MFFFLRGKRSACFFSEGEEISMLGPIYPWAFCHTALLRMGLSFSLFVLGPWGDRRPVAYP